MISQELLAAIDNTLAMQADEIDRLRAKIESNRALYAARDRGIEADAERYRAVRVRTTLGFWDGTTQPGLPSVVGTFLSFDEIADLWIDAERKANLEASDD